MSPYTVFFHVDVDVPKCTAKIPFVASKCSRRIPNRIAITHTENTYTEKRSAAYMWTYVKSRKCCRMSKNIFAYSYSKYRYLCFQPIEFRWLKRIHEISQHLASSFEVKKQNSAAILSGCCSIFDVKIYEEIYAADFLVCVHTRCVTHQHNHIQTRSSFDFSSIWIMYHSLLYFYFKFCIAQTH